MSKLRSPGGKAVADRLSAPGFVPLAINDGAARTERLRADAEAARLQTKVARLTALTEQLDHITCRWSRW